MAQAGDYAFDSITKLPDRILILSMSEDRSNQKSDATLQGSGAPEASWDSESIRRIYPLAWHLASVRTSKGGKRVEVTGPGGESREILLSRFTYIFDRLANAELPNLSNRDFFTVEESGQEMRVRKICTDGLGGLTLAAVAPYFSRSYSIKIAASTHLKVTCSELVQGGDFDAVRWLNCFHYRSLNMWGRSTGLLMRLEGDSEEMPFKSAIGYIILNSPPLLTRPRDSLMQWDAEGRLRHVDRVVRIARVVVHPEFRGIGAGRLLVEAAIEYANEHWNAAGKKPWLLETVAEMSRFHPVFEAGGMEYCGETMGREEVLITPSDRLDHLMGAGHWRSSLDRMKMKPSTPKPYFAVPVGSCPDRVRKSVKVASGQKPPHLNGLVSARIGAPLIRFEQAAISFGVDGPNTKRFATLLGFDVDKSAEGQLGQGLETLATAISADPVMSGGCSELNESLRTDIGTFVGRLHSLGQAVGKREVKLSKTKRSVASLLGDAAVERLSLSNRLEVHRQTLDDSIGSYFEEGQGDPQRLAALSTARNQVDSLLSRLRNASASTREVEIMTAFGLDEISSEHGVVSDFNLDILPGQVVLLEGASGCGKTSILESLLGSIRLSGGKLLPEGVASSVAAIDLNFAPETAVIDLLGCCTREACRFLNAAGISESKVYIKRRHQLSHGQRYRVAAAVLAASGKGIWLADEFCAFLDPLTSALVANGISRLARSVGATLIVASADSRRIAKALQPDITVRLISGGRPTPDPRVLFWKNHDFRSIAAGWLHGKTPTDKELKQVLWEHDLIFHRLTSERSLSSGDVAQLARKLVEDLKPIASQWSEIALKRQVGYRIEALAEVGNYMPEPVKGTKKPPSIRRSIKSRH